MLQTKKLLPLILCVALLALAIPFVSAQDTSGINVTTYSDSAMTHQAVSFGIGSTVYIGWIMSTPGPVDITIVNANTNVQVADLGTFAYTSQPASWTTTAEGTYYVIANGVETSQITVGQATIVVTPENAVGVVVTLGVAFAALGVFGVVKRRNA